jgi:hypothetical protein
VSLRLYGVLAALPVVICTAQTPAPREPTATFGVTVVMSSGLRGDIYFLPSGTLKLPKFQRLKPEGSIYTATLNVTPRDFSEGFPGVTDRFEWFAIDYNGRFWIQEPGKYNFNLMSDDGSKLYIDGKTVIDNDGVHASVARTGGVTLKTGVHRIRVSYFQGPRFHVSLMLGVARPGQEWRVFNMDRFLPPPGHDDWK